MIALGLCGLAAGCRREAPELIRLSRRLVEPRLSAFQYAPFVPVSSRQLTAKERQALRAATLYGKENQSQSPRDWRSAGVFALVFQREDNAVAFLESAARATPDSAPDKPTTLSDLAAAYLVRASSPHRPADPRDLIAALDATEQALHLDPRCPEALYNSALALQRLFLPEQALRAWQEYLAVETDPGWSGEARAALAKLQAPPQETWGGVQKQLRQAVAKGDAAAVTALTDRFRQEARTLAEEESLAAWASLHNSRPEEAQAELALARAIGRSLVQLSGERLLADTVAGIDAALRSDPGRLELLVQGLLAFREGLLLLRDRSFARAEEPLERARTALRQAASPFAAWPSYLLIRCAYQRGDAPAVDRQFRKLSQGMDAARYPVIAARARWTLGTSQLDCGRPAEALASYQWALARFTRTRELGQEAAMHSLLAGAFDQLGDVRSAWQHHRLALRGFAERRNPERLRLALIEAAFAALDAGYPRAAVRLQSAAVEIARQGGDPEVLTNTLLNRAMILDRAGLPGAESDLAAAQEQSLHLQDPSLRSTLQEDLLMAEGAHFERRDPARAVELLTTAVERLSADDRRLPLPPALALRAAARRALGQQTEAEQDLRQAIELLEEERGSVPQADRRASFLARVDSTYDAMVLLQADRGEVERALDYSERRRGRVLLDWLSALPEDLDTSKLRLHTWAHPRPVRELQPRLPSGVALVVYEPLADRLLIWVVRREKVELRSVQVPAAEISRQAQRLSRALDGPERMLQETAGRLHRSLITPVAGLFRPDDTLVFVPRGPLYSVPFALLFDPQTGRYLIEDHAFAVSPSLNAFAALQPPPGSADFSRVDVLAITDPAFDRSLYPLLGRLPAAQREGQVLRDLYGSHTQWISGDAATRETFLEGLKRARLLHFGGHAEAHASHPLLSSLLLSPRPERGDSGVLYTREIVGPRDSVTELAVLSACGSAAGAAQPGEGVAGIVWPLFARGVPQVVATLWNVKDTEAATLTTLFYRHLHAGASPLQALRRTQLEILTANRRAQNHSFDWAAFQLYGSLPPGGMK